MRKFTLFIASLFITIGAMAQTVVTTINTAKYYTLECRSGYAHSTARFIGVTDAGVINGQSSEPAYVTFEAAEVGSYYIKVGEKYINYDGSQLTASTEKSTAWVLGTVGNTVTFKVTGTTLYLNNNGTGADNTTITNLKANNHDSGPSAGNACSTWEMKEYNLPVVLDLTGEQIGTNYPVKLDDEKANAVYRLNDLTVVVKMNTSTLQGRKALFATSDPTKEVNSSAMGMNSYYVGYGVSDAAVGYLASWKSGDRFTQSGLTADTNDVLVAYVIDKTNNSYKMYINGTLAKSWENAHQDGFMSGYEIATPGMVKADYPDANIYIGGAVHSGGNGEVFNGEITELKVFDGALTAEQIALIFEDQEQLATAREAFDAAYATAGEIVAEANLQVTPTAIDLQTSNPDAANYVWGNNNETSEGPIADLVDGNTNNFYHTNWHGGGETPHWIAVDLGEGNALSEFAFSYHTRTVNSQMDYPDEIHVLGSNEKDGEYTEVYSVSSGLPQADNTPWTSGLVSSEIPYRYYRFVVTAERTYWHMAEFDIYELEYTTNENYTDVAKEIYSLSTLYTTHANNSNYGVAALNAATEALNNAAANVAHTLKVGAAGWATLILGNNTVIPESIKAYTITEINNGYVTLTQVTGVLPANEAVIIEATTDNYYFVKTTTKEVTSSFENNLLEGTLTDENIYKEAYVLANGDKGVGLYKAEMNQADGTAFLNNANKAYLPKPAGAANVACYSFRFDGTTGIENVEGQSEGTAIYDLMGRRVENPTRGIYVINGKKVLVK